MAARLAVEMTHLGPIGCNRLFLEDDAECDGDACDGTPYQFVKQKPQATLVLDDYWQTTYRLDKKDLTIDTVNYTIELKATWTARKTW
jgi:hypothetical protein